MAILRDKKTGLEIKITPEIRCNWWCFNFDFSCNGKPIFAIEKKQGYHMDLHEGPGPAEMIRMMLQGWSVKNVECWDEELEVMMQISHSDANERAVREDDIFKVTISVSMILLGGGGPMNGAVIHLDALQSRDDLQKFANELEEEMLTCINSSREKIDNLDHYDPRAYFVLGGGIKRPALEESAEVKVLREWTYGPATDEEAEAD